MKRTNLISQVMAVVALFLLNAFVYAGKPVWTFTPLTATSITVPVNGTATIQYQVSNQSSTKLHQLVMMPIPGVSQDAPCNINPKEQPGESCTLTLTVTGSKIPEGGISGGPNLCQTNPDGTPNPNQCYQPILADSLTIAAGAEPFTVSLAANPITVNAGQMTTLTAAASHGTSPYTYAYSNLPTGCTSANTASLSCTPTAAGTYANITVTVTDNVGDTITSSPITVTVHSAPSASLAASPPTINLGQITTLTATAGGGTPPYTYTYSNLPTGCTSANTASLSCTPTAAGTYANITVTVTDNVGDTITSSPVTVTVILAAGIGSLLTFGGSDSAATSILTPGGTLRFMEMFFYNNSSTLLGVVSYIDNTYGYAFTSGSTISWSGSSIYNMVSNAGITPSSVASMKLFMSGGAQSSNSASCTNFTESCSSGTSTCTTSNSAQSVSWSSPSSLSACQTPRHAYISENTTNSGGTRQVVYLCNIDTSSSGALDSCVLTGPGTGGTPPYLQSITLGNVISNHFGYFANTPTNSSGGSSSTTAISICPINTDATIDSNGTHCMTASGVTFASSSPRGIALSAGYVYAMDGTLGIVPCSINNSAGVGTYGGLTCSSTGMTGYTSGHDPRGIAVNNNVLYIANNTGGSGPGQGSIQVCPLTHATTTSGCTESSATENYVNNPRGIAIYNNYLYFTNNVYRTTAPNASPNATSVVACGPLNADGSIPVSSCVSLGSADQSQFPGASAGSNGIAIDDSTGTVYAYIPVQTSTKIMQCTVSGTTVNSCVQTAMGVTFSTPIGISIF